MRATVWAMPSIARWMVCSESRTRGLRFGSLSSSDSVWSAIGDNGVVDVVADAARHLAEGAQPFLLHHRMLGLLQIVIGLLQRFVELRLMRGEPDMLAELAQELHFPAAEALRHPPRHDQHGEHALLDLQRRNHQRTQAGLGEAL